MTWMVFPLLAPRPRREHSRPPEGFSRFWRDNRSHLLAHSNRMEGPMAPRQFRPGLQATHDRKDRPQESVHAITRSGPWVAVHRR